MAFDTPRQADELERLALDAIRGLVPKVSGVLRPTSSALDYSLRRVDAVFDGVRGDRLQQASFVRCVRDMANSVNRLVADGVVLLPPRHTYATFTEIALGLPFGDFGRCTFNTPSLNSADTLVASTSVGSAKRRTNLP